mmetsp:Transcript_65037/g.149226  ORF Transcript_65037/g.149226 Transcript_65037/m.149226 type:complete len:285 (-) Transcript_65037:490-1344(-)
MGRGVPATALALAVYPPGVPLVAATWLVVFLGPSCRIAADPSWVVRMVHGWIVGILHTYRSTRVGVRIVGILHTHRSTRVKIRGSPRVWSARQRRRAAGAPADSSVSLRGAAAASSVVRGGAPADSSVFLQAPRLLCFLHLCSERSAVRCSLDACGQRVVDASLGRVRGGCRCGAATGRGRRYAWRRWYRGCLRGVRLRLLCRLLWLPRRRRQRRRRPWWLCWLLRLRLRRRPLLTRANSRRSRCFTWARPASLPVRTSSRVSCAAFRCFTWASLRRPPARCVA